MQVQRFQGCGYSITLTQGSLGPSRTCHYSATLGFVAESLWDSRPRGEPFGIPTGFRTPAQGCEERATLGIVAKDFLKTPKGFRRISIEWPTTKIRRQPHLTNPSHAGRLGMFFAKRRMGRCEFV